MSGVMKLRISQNAGNTLTGETAACQEAFQYMHVSTQNFSLGPGGGLTLGLCVNCVLFLKLRNYVIKIMSSDIHVPVT